MPQAAASVLVTLGEELLGLVGKHCRAKKIPVSAYIRAVVARDLKRADLADGVAPGRPRKTPAAK